ncbi:MAG TPA: PP2C family protein-serine/threonine phosphatase [Terriglobales bacterium]|nr:PP2C family protein-serine/threonine phosphatase [Terriglobales bacterium]
MNRPADMRGRSNRENRFPYSAWGIRSKAALHSQEASASTEILQARNRVLEDELAGLARQRDGLQRALSDAAQVQRKLTGPRRLRRGDFEIALESFATQHVTGDVLTAFDVGERTLFAIGDICGKGLYAGMWFTHVAGLIRIFASSCPDPAQIAAAIHSHLVELQPEPPLVTLFIGCLDSGTGELVYCNAGHPDPLLLRAADNQLEQLSTGGPLLGAMEGMPFSNGHARLAPGETLIGYSDGVVECRNGNGDDFAPEKLAAAARAAGGNSATAILFSVLGATQDFAATQPRADDVALLVVHRLARESEAMS